MIRFKAYNQDGTRAIYGIGLSRTNLDRLAQGRPVAINLADQGGPDLDLVIVGGDTEEALFRELQAADLIHPDATYRAVDPGEHVIQRIKIDDPEDEERNDD
jgi:hypothetical protein